MTRYIGLDAHSESCTIAVLGQSGKRLRYERYQTSAELLKSFIKEVPRPRHLCMEEGTQSEWLYQVLSPHAKQVVVIGLSERSGLQKQKNDELDAYDLADRHRRDALPKTVFKDAGQLTSLR